MACVIPAQRDSGIGLAYASQSMETARRFTFAHRWVAAFVVAVALAMKVLIPAGYMVGSAGNALTIMICDQQGAQPVMPGMAPMKGHGAGEHRSVDHQCPYSALAMNALSAADPLLLETALVFIVLLGLASLQPPWWRPGDRLRPPLRGPPIAR